MKMIINKTKMDHTLSLIMMTLVYWANVRGQNAEDTITDVDGSDCDKFWTTFTPADIFKTHILDKLHCLFCSGWGVDDLAVLHIVFSKDSHFHL